MGQNVLRNDRFLINGLPKSPIVEICVCIEVYRGKAFIFRVNFPSIALKLFQLFDCSLSVQSFPQFANLEIIEFN